MLVPQVVYYLSSSYTKGGSCKGDMAHLRCAGYYRYYTVFTHQNHMKVFPQDPFPCRDGRVTLYRQVLHYDIVVVMSRVKKLHKHSDLVGPNEAPL